MPLSPSSANNDDCKSLPNKILHSNNSAFRSFLAQLAANGAKNLVALNLTMSLGYSSVAIKALLHRDSDLNFTDEQASWFGSLPYFMFPIGSLISAIIFEPSGRKRVMMATNIPHMLFWLICWQATAAWQLIVASAFCGVAAGFTAPCLTYTAEISEPKWRGILTSFTGVTLSIGYAVVLCIGTVTDWQNCAFIGFIIPFLGMAAVSQIPESPVWLLSKSRNDEALESLCWLRGWTGPDAVKEEFHQLQEYNNNFYKRPENEETTGLIRRLIVNYDLDALVRQRTILAMMICVVSLFVNQASGVFATRPYVVLIMEEFNSPIDPHASSVILSLIGVLGNLMCTAMVRKAGKRRLAIATQALCAIITFSITITHFLVNGNEKMAWLPVALYILLSFTWSCGIAQVPLIYLSEIFPVHGRTVACGLCGVFGIYTVISAVGLVVLYLIIPETEGKTLQEIENTIQEKYDKLRYIFFRKTIIIHQH